MTEPSLLSRQILDRLRREAANAPRGQKRLATLDRLATACDDIANGRARTYAAQVGIDDARFGHPRRPFINSRSVNEYVRIRAKLDARKGVLQSDTTWTGPHDATIRSDIDLKSYVRARQEEALGLRKPRPEGTRVRKLGDIVAAISDDADRVQMLNALEDLYQAQGRYQILRGALRTIPGLDVDNLLDPGREPGQSVVQVFSPIDPAQRQILRKLVVRITDARTLSAFGLKTDQKRVLMDGPPGSHLVEKDELTLLSELANVPPE